MVGKVEYVPLPTACRTYYSNVVHLQTFSLGVKKNYGLDNLRQSLDVELRVS